MQKIVYTIKGVFIAILPLALGIMPETIEAQCPGLGSITLNITPAPSPTLSTPQPLCPGASGSISVSPSFSSYNWNTGATTQSINVSSPGSYTVTVTTASGCTATQSTTVTAAPAPTPSISAAPYACDGQITLNTSGTYSSYAWSNGGGNGASATYNANGTYTVTVSNSEGCTATSNYLVAIPSPPVVAISGPASFCDGQTINLSATAGFTGYNWSPGGNGSTISISIAGTYTVTATNNQGCTATASVTVDNLPSPFPLTSTVAICPGASATLEVTNAVFQSYTWSTGSNTANTTVNTAGIYTVTVTGANGCTGTATATATALPAPTPSIVAATYICNGQITLSADAGLSNYAWNTGAATESISAVTNGTYTVTVTNGVGCTGIAQASVSIPPPPVVAINGNNVFCENASTLLSASSGFVNYQWNSGQNTASITVNNGGAYIVTVSDTYGCTATAELTVSSLPNPTPAITGPQTVCTGDIAIFSVSGGAFSGYQWNTGSNAGSIQPTVSGTYTVTVTASNGCTASDTQALTVLPAPVPAPAQLAYQCNLQRILQVAAGFTAYTWSTGDNTSSIQVTANGFYTVTVSDAQGCTASASILADVPPLPTVNIQGGTAICPGASATLQADPGFSLYAWSTNANTPSLTVSNAGNFTVTVTDNNGCTATAAATVQALTAPVVQISGPAQVCSGSAATLSVPASYASYIWSNGIQSPATVVNNGGTYTVTVTASNGCTASDTQALTVLPAPVPAPAQLAYQCNLQRILQVAAGFTAYTWSTGDNTSSIQVTANGFYTVTVSDAQGCTASASILADVPPLPTVNIQGGTAICPGASATLQADPGFSLYSWSTNANTPSLTVSNAGNFTVTVTDNNGCTATAAATVQALTAPMVQISGPAQVCSGSAATLSVPASYASYIWSNGIQSPATVVNNGGTYTVTVTASNGCTASDLQTLTVVPAPVPAPAQLAYQCNLQRILQAAAGFTAYIWSTGGTTPSIQVNTNGVYTVTVTDTQGCTASAIVAADIPPLPVVNIQGGTGICPGATTALQADPGFYLYSWSTNANTPSLTVNNAGNYTVTVTDNNGCTATDVAGVQVLAAPSVQISGPIQICTGSSATLSVPASYASYIWSNGIQTPATTVSNSGNYTVTVTDVNGCTATDVQNLSIANSLQPQITPLPYTCNGTIQLDAGSGYATYAWSTGANTPVVDISVAGNFTVTVTDGTGCIGSTSFATTIPSSPSLTISGPVAACNGTTASLQASGGFSTYNWNTAQVGNLITTTQPGSYTVTATDALGCSAVASFTIMPLPAPQPDIQGDPLLCANTTGALSLSATYATYQWSTGATAAAISISAGGFFTVTVTDSNGCTGTDTFLVTTATPAAPTISQLPYACNGAQTITAGQGYVAYSWSNSQTSAQINVTSNGLYSVTVTDAQGCTAQASFEVIIPTPPVLAISGNATFCSGQNSQLIANQGFSNYIWNTGAVTAAINVSQTGPYTVTATDALGCTFTDSQQVTALALPTPQITSPANYCQGQTATLTLGQTYSTYLWSTGSNSASLTVNTGGIYAVTVTNDAGCTGAAALNVNFQNLPQPAILQQPYACNGQIVLNAGSSYSAYAWNTGATGQINTVTVTGAYTVTVSDSNGCTGSATAFASIPTPLSLTVTGDAILCPDETTVLSASTGFASYIWNTGSTAGALSTGFPGFYSVTATAANGCTTTASLTVTVSSPPSLTISGPSTVCQGETAILQATGNFASLVWSSGETTPVLSQTAPYSVTATATNNDGCTATAFATVGAFSLPTPAITQQNFVCTGQVQLNSGTGYAAYAWNTGATTAQISVSQTGLYTVTVTNANNCTASTTTQVTIPPLGQVAVSGKTVICPAETTALTAANGFAAYLWSTGISQQELTVNSAGLYTVTATDQSGCTSTASVTITTLPAPAPVISGPTTDCSGGPVSLTVQGGVFSQIQWAPQPVNTISLLVDNSGAYQVTVTDANGCTASATHIIVIGEPVEETILKTTCRRSEAGTRQFSFTSAAGCDSIITVITRFTPDNPQLQLAVDSPIEAIIGQSITLTVNGNFDIDSVWYKTGLQLSCLHCLTPQLTATQSGNILVTAQDSGGCQVSKTILVKVKRQLNVYVPNVFKPGSDDNSFFSVYAGPEIPTVRNFHVFDRWGNELYRRDELPTNAPENGWDGNFRGQPMQPGVYAYYFEVPLADGSVEIFSGDVTIME